VRFEVSTVVFQDMTQSHWVSVS